MNGNTMTLFKTIALTASVMAAAQAFAEDWAIAAVASCNTLAGNTTISGGGLRATGGTAVVRCPLTKEVGNNTINNVFARMKRASTSGSNSLCTVFSMNHYGSPTSAGSSFAANTTANQSVNINLPPTQHSFGYAYVDCALTSGDILYGIRYLQDN